MKILLVNPMHHPHSMNFSHCMDLVGVKYSHMPLALPTLAALTPKDCKVEALDENVTPIPASTDADIVALTGSVPQRNRLFELADLFRKQGKFVVIGGPVTFDMQEQCKKHADTVFVGEAEYTWPEFIADYKTGNPKGLYHQKEWINLEDSPVPTFDIFNPGSYASGCIQVTRGCPNRCDFCDIPVRYGSQPRSKKVEQVLTEIRTLSGLGYEAVFIVDDNFAGNREYAKRLLKAIAEMLPTLPTKLYFYTQATLDIASDEELLKLMRAANFLRVFIGIETGSMERLKELNKKHQLDLDINLSVKKIQSYGITVWAGIMFGLENDDVGSFNRQLEFIRNASFFPIQIGLLQAVPETALYKRVTKKNRLIELPSIYGITALSEADLQKTTNIMPENMRMAELEQNFSRVVREMFSPKFFNAKMKQFIEGTPRSMMASLPALNMKTVRVLSRLSGYYLFKADKDSRKMFISVLGYLISKGGKNLFETVFHLVIYKHMRTHYYRIAEICDNPK